APSAHIWQVDKVAVTGRWHGSNANRGGVVLQRPFRTKGRSQGMGRLYVQGVRLRGRGRLFETKSVELVPGTKSPLGITQMSPEDCLIHDSDVLLNTGINVTATKSKGKSASLAV
ncbi:MAG: hypothetical protein WAK31_10950, partial [Chthoniobacterales bacterium]